jgi:Spy/CpxP family protein refolding chaperone
MMRFVMTLALAASLAAPAFAQTAGTANMEIFKQKIKADKKLLVAQNLNLTEAEGTAFWPLYDAYQKDLEQANQRLSAMIVAYADAYNKGPVANDAAKKLIDEALAIEESETRQKSAVAQKVLAVLPAAKAARYIQMENKVRALIRYELAANIPLVE